MYISYWLSVWGEWEVFNIENMCPGISSHLSEEGIVEETVYRLRQMRRGPAIVSEDQETKKTIGKCAFLFCIN